MKYDYYGQDSDEPKMRIQSTRVETSSGGCTGRGSPAEGAAVADHELDSNAARDVTCHSGGAGSARHLGRRETSGYPSLTSMTIIDMVKTV
jgi:hypothetical protein